MMKLTNNNDKANNKANNNDKANSYIERNN